VSDEISSYDGGGRTSSGNGITLGAQNSKGRYITVEGYSELELLAYAVPFSPKEAK
jgi:hypothetical protein